MLDTEKGAVHTLLQLALRPGKTARAFVEGRRTALTGPGRLFILVYAINVGMIAIFGRPAFLPVRIEDDHGTLALDNAFLSIQLGAVICFLMYLLALIHRALYWRTNLRLAEHFSMLLYVATITSAFIMVIELILAVAIDFPSSSTEGLIALIVFTGYLIMSNKQFYELSWPKSVLMLVASFAPLIALSFLTNHLLASP